MNSVNQPALTKDFRLWLQSKLMERCRNNPRYSLRSFANFLEMDASSVSQIISGKRKASKKVITMICNRLSVSPSQLAIFLAETVKKNQKDSSPSDQMNYELIAEDAFAYISNWYHYAILELTFTKSCENNPARIAQVLSISITEAKIAIERLLRMNLLTEDKGRLKKTTRFLTNVPDAVYTAGPQRELQRQILKLGLEAIDRCKPEEKDITSMTMAIDVKKLPEAKKLITKFRRDMCAFLEEGQQTRVYNLAIQLYPVSHNENFKERQ